MLKNLLKRLSIDRAAALLIFLGTTVWSLTMVKSGLLYTFGMGFWGPNGHDGVWHISLIESLSKGSLGLPIFAGEQIKNYHIGFDIFLAMIHRVTNIPVVTLYFQIFPVVAALAVGLLTYKLVYVWKKDRSSAFWSTFFVYFAGNFGWIVAFVKSNQLGGESTFWAQPSILSLVNPPFALSLIFILTGLLVLARTSVGIKNIIVASVIFGLLVQIKAYAGIIVVGALAVASVYEFITKKTHQWLVLFILSALVSFFVFMPFYSSGSLLEFKPFWFLETMMAFPDRVGWLKYASAMVNYRLGGNIKAVFAYGLALLMFWYGNIGMRLVGEIYWIKLIRNRSEARSIDVFLASAMILGVVMPMLFVQKGTPWNTIQFYYYSLFIMSLVGGVAFAGILKNISRVPRIIVIVGTILLSSATAVSVLKHYLPERPPAMIGRNELNALNYLRDKPEGLVLAMPFDRSQAGKAVENPPRPLYLYESTAYISAFSSKQVWIEDEVNLSITDYPWQKRRGLLEASLFSPDSFKDFLEQNNISYVYAVGYQKERYQNVLGGIRQIYDKDGVAVYEIQ